VEKTHKHCPKCALTKAVADFYISRTRSDGLDAICRACQRTFYVKNKKVISEKAKAKYAANKDVLRARHREALKLWREKNLDKNRNYAKAYAKRNQAACLARKRDRDARLQKTSLPTVSVLAMQVIYERAALLTLMTGVPHHVDHIVPLRGKNVSGLHVPWNLRCLPARDNLRKYNKMD